jgi:hypothetical protein
MTVYSKAALDLTKEQAVVAERERCARLVEGDVFMTRYRQWPKVNDGSRSNESEIVKLCDALAALIRSGA